MGMRHSDMMAAPARHAMRSLGFEELRTADEVDAFLQRPGTTLLAVNSMCGCASGTMRPAVSLALGRSGKPDHVGTVFAGQDLQATARAREHLAPHPPTSPAVAIFRDGKLVFLMQRDDIRGRQPDTVADTLATALARTSTEAEG
jgi:putative YphP/YqiW family bacilliredoxin